MDWEDPFLRRARGRGWKSASGMIASTPDEDDQRLSVRDRALLQALMA